MSVKRVTIEQEKNFQNTSNARHIDIDTSLSFATALTLGSGT